MKYTWLITKGLWNIWLAFMWAPEDARRASMRKLGDFCEEMQEQAKEEMRCLSNRF